jgi:hypothetical protein
MPMRNCDKFRGLRLDKLSLAEKPGKREPPL